MKTRNITLLTGAALAASLILAGCSTSSGMEGMDHGDTSEPDPTVIVGAFNDADVMFATMMIPHHQQAVEMSQVVLEKDGVDERVTNLALAI